MSINKDSQKAPNLRFKGFTDDWEQRKLGEESTIVAGGDVDKTKLLKAGRYPVLANALTNDGIVGYYEDNYRIEAPAVTVTGRGDVGYAKARKANFTPVVRLLAVKSEHDVGFLEAAINNHKTIVESTGVPQLTAPQLSNYNIYFPLFEEEKKIGSFFKQFDDTITLHQRKLDQLKQLKAVLLQQMFPGKGETVPKLRFAGFEGDWEERKYIDVCKITMGQSPDGANYTQNPSDHILVQGNADMKNGEVVPRIWTTQVTKVANVNDIILGVRAPVGVVGITKYDVVIGRGVAGIKGSIFIYYDLVQKLNNNYWSKYSTGSTFDSINSEDIKNASIYFPNLAEQNHIGTFFKSLDNTITLQQRKLDQLNNMKQVLLQNMFI